MCCINTELFHKKFVLHRKMLCSVVAVLTEMIEIYYKIISELLNVIYYNIVVSTKDMHLEI